MTNEPGNTVLYQGRFLALRKRKGWEFVDRPNVADVAVMVAVTDAREAVFVEQYRLPVEAKMIEWPAGLVGDEEGHGSEDLLAAANRELEEETGYRAGKLSLIEKNPSSGGLTSEVVTFIRASALKKVSAGGGVPGENITVHLVALEDVDAWLQARAAEGYLIDPKVYAGLYFLKREESGRLATRVPGETG